jgi:hypothetical protein
LLQLNEGWDENEPKFIQVANAFIPLAELSLELSNADILYSARMQLRTMIKMTENNFGKHEQHRKLIELLQRITDKEEQLKSVN